MTDKRNFAMLVMSYFAIFFLYSVIYAKYVYPYNSCSGYSYHFSLKNLIFSCSFLYFSATLFDFIDDFSEYFLSIFTIIYIIPALVLFSFGGAGFVYLLWMLVAFVLLAIASKLKLGVFSEVGTIDERCLSRLLLGLALVLIVVASYLNGFRFVFNIYDVYHHRSIVNAHVGPSYNYITAITSKVVLPFIAVISLSSKRYFEALLAIIMSVVLFSITGHKGVLLYTVISMGIYVFNNLFPRIYHLNLLFTLMLGVAAIDAVAAANLGIDGVAGRFVDLIVRRGLFTPPLLDYLYIDYFTHHNWYWWSSSRATLGLVPPPYPVTAPFLIGIEYFQKPTLSANTGFIGSGFSQAGWFGMAIYAAVLGAVIAVARAMEVKFDRPVLISLLFVPIVTAMTGADLLTTFLTHGMLLSFVFLLISRGRKGNA